MLSTGAEQSAQAGAARHEGNILLGLKACLVLRPAWFEGLSALRYLLGLKLSETSLLGLKACQHCVI